MDKRKILIATLSVAAAVLAFVLRPQFIANTELVPLDPQVDENAVAIDLVGNLAIDEIPARQSAASSDDDGLFASVNWRNRWSGDIQLYPRTFLELRALAENGDVEAMRRLVGLLQMCENAALPMSEAELSAVITEMRASYSLPKLSDGRFEFPPESAGQLGNLFSSEAEFNSFVDEWLSNTKTCTSVTTKQRNEVDHWLGMLELHGAVPVTSTKSTRHISREEKLAHVDSRWASGDPYALAEYAEIYSNYELQLIDPTARMKAYAYISAFYEALIETAKHHSDADGLAELRYSLGRIRENYSALLSEHEVGEAHELARQIILANENCCIRLSPRLYGSSL
jgi:hypothetical protein